MQVWQPSYEMEEGTQNVTGWRRSSPHGDAWTSSHGAWPLWSLSTSTGGLEMCDSYDHSYAQCTLHTNKRCPHITLPQAMGMQHFGLHGGDPMGAAAATGVGHHHLDTKAHFDRYAQSLQHQWHQVGRELSTSWASHRTPTKTHTRELRRFFLRELDQWSHITVQSSSILLLVCFIFGKTLFSPS